MNSLSWLIYFAGVTENLQYFLITAGILVLFIFGIAFVVMTVNRFDYDDPDHRPLLFKWLWAPLMAIFVACLCPSSTTLYAIVASEMGEELLNSSTGTKAQQALEAWLDRQIEGVIPNDGG